MTVDSEAAETQAEKADVGGTPIVAPLSAFGAGTVDRVMALQRLLGNRTTTRLVARAERQLATNQAARCSNLASAPRRLSRQDAAAPLDKWKGTLVTYIVINSASGRAVFHTASGDDISGTIKTDLKPGTYTVRPDQQNADTAKGASMRWVFDPGQVPSGIRFDVGLDDALPETLVYPTTLPVIVTVGLTKPALQQLVANSRRSLGQRAPLLIDLRRWMSPSFWPRVSREGTPTIRTSRMGAGCCRVSTNPIACRC
jgi:hypothetical protein